MKMFAYRGKHENFGDELNHWLWERLLPGFFDEDEGQLFLGIGSILYDNFDPKMQKIVFGSGYGGYTNPPKVDDNWTFYFVRGKKTAEILGIDPSYAIGDSGILTRSCWDAKSVEKRYPVSFMPHYESAMYGSWDKVCDLAGIHYIDPRWSVEKVLTEISASQKVVSEAMHGCIISDALRVRGGRSGRSRRATEPSGMTGRARSIWRSISIRSVRRTSSRSARRWCGKTHTC